MDTESLIRLERLFLEAQTRPPEERAAFLEAACPEDPALRREVEQLLAAADDDLLDVHASQPRPERTAPRGGASVPGWLPFVRDPDGSDLVGQVVDHRYEIGSVVGSGGMGRVYRARDRHLNRDVALKVLSPYLSADETAKRRLLHEARAASSLEHPNICTIFQVGQLPDGQLYVAMAYYDGETVREKIARGPLSPDAAVGIAVKVAQGLQGAHEAGIVHRDVKPANVMVTAHGLIKLLDFGGATRADARITKTGSQIGTAAYMSPEQAQGEAVDARTDLWSLGVVLYEMLTGVRPFEGENEPALLYAIVHHAPTPVRTLRPEVPEALAQIVDRLLQKDPADRYPDAQTVLADLRSGHPPRRARRPARRRVGVSRRWNRRWKTWGGGVAALLLALALLFALRGESLLRGGSAPITSLAVLPLASYSADTGETYFADGMTEELISALGQIEALRVISRTSAMRYRDTDKSLPEIARELGVDAIVEGSVARGGDRVQIAVRLVNGRTEEWLWEQRFERGLRNVLALQHDIALAISQEIEVTLSSTETARLRRAPTVVPAAFDLYLRGVQIQNQLAYARQEEATRYFEQAIAIDSTFAPAYARLAMAYALSWTRPREETAPRARRFAEQALRLDPTLPEAYIARGLIHQFYEWDWVRAERALDRAVALNPSNDEAHHERAQLLLRLGRFEEARVAEQRALHVNPLSALYWSGLGAIDVCDRQYERGIDHLERSLALESGQSATRLWLGKAYFLAGRMEEGQAAWRDNPFVPPWMVDLQAAPEASAAVRAQVEAWAAQWERGEGTPFAPWDLALAHAALGDADRAIDWLDRAVEARLPVLSYLVVEPTLAPLHADPRFQRILEAVGLVSPGPVPAG